MTTNNKECKKYFSNCLTDTWFMHLMLEQVCLLSFKIFVANLVVTIDARTSVPL